MAHGLFASLFLVLESDRRESKTWGGDQRELEICTEEIKLVTVILEWWTLKIHGTELFKDYLKTRKGYHWPPAQRA